MGMLQQLSEFSADWAIQEAAEGRYRQVKPAYNVRSKITYGAAPKKMTVPCSACRVRHRITAFSKIGIDDNEAK
jgi:hypothetical protein